MSSNLITRLGSVPGTLPFINHPRSALEHPFRGSKVSYETQNLENEKVIVEATTHPHCRISLNITVQPDYAEKLHKNAVKKVSKEISFPGFRKGKVPQEVVTKKFSKEIENEFRDMFVNDSFYEAIQLLKRAPVQESRPKISTLLCARTGGSFKIEYDAVPVIPTVDPKALNIPSDPAPQFTDQDVETQLGLLRYRSADWQPAEDKTLAPGDSVVIDLEVHREGEKEPFIQQDNTMYVDEKYMEKWLFPHLQGLKIGDVATGEIEEKAPEGETLPKQTFKATVKEIHTAELPAIDEKLAEKFGLKSPEELKEAIRKQLDVQYKEQLSDLMHKIVQSELLEKYPYDLPESYIEAETKDRISRRVDQMRQENKSEAEIAAATKEMEPEIREGALRSLRLYFLMQEIITKHHIHATQEETFGKLMSIMRNNAAGFGQMPQEMRQEFFAKIHKQLTYEKALDWLIQHATGNVEPHDHKNCGHDHGDCGHHHEHSH